MLPHSLHIIGSKDGGGAENFYVRLLLALRAHGARVTGIHPPHSEVARQLGDRVAQREIAMRGIWDLPARYALRRAIKAAAPQIVQTYMGRATRLTHLRPGRVPVHVARLGGYYDLKGYRHAHAWIGNTRGICDYLIQSGLPAARVFHIGNFVAPALPVTAGDLRALRDGLGLPDEAWVLVSIGRLHPNKGFTDLLAAMGELPTTVAGRPVHLVIVGDGPLRAELEHDAARLPQATRIHFVGWQTALDAYYTLADLFVCPSRHEPLGNVILEAWAQGKTVLATATQGATELIMHDQDGALTPVENPTALALAIQTLLTDDSRRAALALGGAATLAAQHSEARIVNAYLDLYQHLVAHPPCAG